MLELSRANDFDAPDSWAVVLQAAFNFFVAFMAAGAVCYPVALLIVESRRGAQQ